MTSRLQEHATSSASNVTAKHNLLAGSWVTQRIRKGSTRLTSPHCILYQRSLIITSHSPFNVSSVQLLQKRASRNGPNMQLGEHFKRLPPGTVVGRLPRTQQSSPYWTIPYYCCTVFWLRSNRLLELFVTPPQATLNQGPESRKVKSVRVAHPNWAQSRVCLVPVNISFVAGLERARPAALVASSARSISTLISFTHTHTPLHTLCDYGSKLTLQGRNGTCTGRPKFHAKCPGQSWSVRERSN